MNNKQIVLKLNAAKKQQGLTLKQLAERSGVSLGTVNKIMSGALQDIKSEKLQKLAAALGLNSQQLIEDSQQKETQQWLGIAKVACVSPEVRVADCTFNAEKIAEGAEKAARMGAKVVVFPELALTGYSCGDLFFQSALRNAALESLQYLCSRLAPLPAVVVVGLPIADNGGKLYNAAAVLFGGEILGVVPKVHLPNYNEFFEKRIFTAAPPQNTTVRIGGKDIPFGSKLLFADSVHNQLCIGVEICEDIWVSSSPSYQHALAGASLIVNLSASDEIVCKAEYRRKLVEIQSGKTCSVYAYCSAGESESTSAVVFSAHNIVCENGTIIAESKPFGAGFALAEADFDFVCNERARMAHTHGGEGYQTVCFRLPLDNDISRVYDNMPFVPDNKQQLAERCKMVFNLQSRALKRRLQLLNARPVIGVSGGSDSTLALLVCKKAMDLLGRSSSEIVAVTMPCFGTTQRTLNNSVALAEALGATMKKIDISQSVTQHLKDIGHDGSPDTTFENAQARERTQVLMDIANSCNGLVVGTGDMSEAALGWSTFNGDQMSMYAVNCTVPKTLVRALIAFEAEHSAPQIKQVLLDVLDTPVSPELLPPSGQDIAQVTEDIVGPYQLHDYFLYMMIRKGFAPAKVFELAKLSFDGIFAPEEILHWLEKFVRRFFSQQFKRSCQPDGPKVGTVDLTKYQLRMPSDASCNVWLENLRNFK